MKRICVLTIGCIGMAAALSACTPQVTASVPNVIRVENVDAGDSKKIAINSTETVQVTPDMAELVYGITTEDTDASRCQQKNTEALAQVLAFLKAEGYQDNSIKTTGFSLEPRYDWSGNSQRLIGYRMDTQVTVTDVPIDKVGGLLSKTVESGANQIQNVSYFSSTYDEAYEEALKKALELARKKAQVLAGASGQSLGNVIKVEEYRDSQYGRYVSSEMTRSAKFEAVMDAAGAADMGVMPGQMQVTANISVEFELVGQ